MNFERMTDDELKRFLLLGTQDLDAARATQEAARRWVAYDAAAAEEKAYDAGKEAGYEDAVYEATLS